MAKSTDTQQYPSLQASPTLKEQESFYDRYWQERENQLNPAEIVRLAHILLAISSLPRKEQQIICDFGCGMGWLSQELRKFGNVVGVDLSPQGIEEARARWPGVKFEAANILEWQPVQKFDLVISSEVIEHVEDKASFVTNVHSILKPGGYLILTTPNKTLKNAWDAGNQGAQVIEQWLTPGELRRLFETRMEILRHNTFAFDCLYAGLFRYTSAPKLLALLRGLKLGQIYDGLRGTLNMGLYQLLVARKYDR